MFMFVYLVYVLCVMCYILVALLDVDPIEKPVLLEHSLCLCMCVSVRVEPWDALGSRQAC